jgi:hypothetical protein
MITFGEAAERGDFIQLERRPPADDDPLAAFNPDDALEKMRELAGSEDNANEVVRLFTQLDNCIVRSGGTRLPQDWQYEPAVHFERLMRNQPRRTSREERRR